MKSISRKTQVKKGFEKLQPSNHAHWTKNLVAARNVRRHYLHDLTEEYKIIRKLSQMRLTYCKWVISTKHDCFAVVCVFSQSLGTCFYIKDWGSWKCPYPVWRQALTTALMSASSIAQYLSASKPEIKKSYAQDKIIRYHWKSSKNHTLPLPCIYLMMKIFSQLVFPLLSGHKNVIVLAFCPLGGFLPWLEPYPLEVVNAYINF